MPCLRCGQALSARRVPLPCPAAMCRGFRAHGPQCGAPNAWRPLLGAPCLAPPARFPCAAVRFAIRRRGRVRCCRRRFRIARIRGPAGARWRVRRAISGGRGRKSLDNRCKSRSAAGFAPLRPIRSARATCISAEDPVSHSPSGSRRAAGLVLTDANTHPSGAAVAQLVEQRIRNAWVGGSSPFCGTILFLISQ